MSAVVGLPHALVTSADEALAQARMNVAGLPMPAVRVTAGQVGAGKPAPEGYLKAAAFPGVAPADCVVLEDSEVGIRAGRAAGTAVMGVGRRAAASAPDVHGAGLTRLGVEPGTDGTVRLRVVD